MRLIDADRALEIVRDQGIAHPNAYHLTNYATLILREAPTVDAVEVRHGYWIPAMHIGDCCYRCSECQFLRDAYLLDIGNYCPKCGAKMGDKLYG